MTEYLGPSLYKRAQWQSNIFNMIRRGEFPGYASSGNSVFTVERSIPPSDDEAWTRVQSQSAAVAGGLVDGNCGPCARNWRPTTAGFSEAKYFPERYEMSGILLCRNDLPLEWNTELFWSSYLKQMEMRGAKTATNRSLNVSMHLVPIAAATASSDFAWVERSGTVPLGGTAAPTPNLSVLPDPTSVNYTFLDQEMLENAVLAMMQAGVTAEDSDGWIQLGPAGIVVPMLIGAEASRQIDTVNPERRLDIRYATEGLGEQMNPLLRRMASSRVIGSTRHIIELYPPRWAWSRGGGWLRVDAQVQVDTSGKFYMGGHQYDLIADCGLSAAAAAALTPSKGYAAQDNPFYTSKNFGTGHGYTQGGALVGAPFEAVHLPNPWVVTEEVIKPISQMANAKWSPTNYMGDWLFVTGSDAKALASATPGTYEPDPAGDYGIHYAQYWHAYKPIYPRYGRTLIFNRCTQAWSTYSC